MEKFFEGFRTGAFVARDRVRVYSLMCLAITFLCILALIITADGKLAYDGKPLGTDFSNVYAAGQMVNDGRVAEVWNWELHFAEQSKVFGPQLQAFFGWHYPPFFLLIASALAVFPYLAALGLWNAAGFVVYLASLRKIAGNIPGWIYPAIGFPAIFVNVTHGHNGFLTAALFGMAFLVIDKRPVIAGVLIGLLAYKPQFGVLIPLALLLGGYYRTFVSASVTVLGMSGFVTVLYGFEIWPAFFESMTLTRDIILEQGETGWFKIQSIFSAVMLWTDWLALAYAMQIALSLAVLAVVCFAFWYTHSIEERAAVLILGSLLVTPYSLDYDLVALAPALAFLVVRGLRDGFADFEVSLLVIAWFAPLITRPLMMVTGIPFALIAMLALFYVLAKRILANSKAQSLKPAQAK